MPLLRPSPLSLSLLLHLLLLLVVLPTFALVASQSEKCNPRVCAGMAHYPTHQRGTSFYSEFDVPALPEALSQGPDEVDSNGFSGTFYIYSNIFFQTSVPKKFNQFVPQLMLGNALSDSTGPPLWKAIWHWHTSWVFEAQYFFQIFNATTGKMEPHAATGKRVPCVEGERLYTSFTLNRDTWVWTLTMGVVGGGPNRTSRVEVPQPYMGLLSNETSSWSETTYNLTYVNSCWELYGVTDRASYPGSGNSFDMEIKQEAGSFPWYLDWKDLKAPLCPGQPTSKISESHNATKQHVLWDLSFADSTTARDATVQ